MTDVLHEPEQHTMPIAQRHYTPAVYDTNATAIIRPDETLILDVSPAETVVLPVASPDTSGDIVPLMRLLQEPPTGPVPPPPPMPAPESLMKPGRTEEYFSPERKRGTTGKRRMPAPWWMHALWGGGLGMVLGALLVGIPVAALVTR